MTRSFFPLAALGFAVCLGCGQNPEVASEAATGPDHSQRSTSSEPGSPEPSPSDVVSQFLDKVRRGGEDSGAGALLTAQAQSELNRIGRTIQPIGSPDAHVEVTRSEKVAGEENSRLVHTIWSEPSGDGTPIDLQVVWALEHQEAGWRISGLAMELEPGAAPTIIDFENGDLMAQLLAEPSESTRTSSPEPETEGDASQAAAPSENVTR